MFHQRLAGQFGIFALEPSAHILDPVDDVAQRRKVPPSLITIDQLVHLELIVCLQPACALLLAGFSFFCIELYLHGVHHFISGTYCLLHHVETIHDLHVLAKYLFDGSTVGLRHVHRHHCLPLRSACGRLLNHMMTSSAQRPLHVASG
jgi:hypothetical protein